MQEKIRYWCQGFPFCCKKAEDDIFLTRTCVSPIIRAQKSAVAWLGCFLFEVLDSKPSMHFVIACGFLRVGIFAVV